MDRGAWRATVHRVAESNMTEATEHTCMHAHGNQWDFRMENNLPAMKDIWVQSLGQKDPLEKETATHSNMLTWIIPWREEPDGLWWATVPRIKRVRNF